MSISQTITYDDPLNFAFDSDLIDVGVGGAELKPLVYANETFFAGFPSSVDGNRGLGVLTGTATGGASVAGGKLDLKGGTLQYVSYAGALNSIINIGTIIAKFTPNYTGNPASSQNIFGVGASGGLSNNISLFHHTDGKFYLNVYDSAGFNIFGGSTTVHAATAGTPISIELALDVTTGDNKLFVNGVALVTSSATGVRTAPTSVVVGSDVSAANTADFEVDYFQMYSDIQHTADFVANGEPTTYSLENPSIVVNSSVLTDGLSSVSEVATKTGSDEIKYLVFFGGVNFYWTGAAWAVSDGTYAQANTIIEINANAATLDLSAGGTLQGKALLHSNNGYSTPTLLSNTYTYSFYISSTDPNECIVYGWVKDSKGEGVLGATVSAAVTAPFFHGENLIKKASEATTNAAGYWEMSLVETASVTQTFLITVDGTTYQVIVPDAASAALSGLV